MTADLAGSVVSRSPHAVMVDARKEYIVRRLELDNDQMVDRDDWRARRVISLAIAYCNYLTAVQWFCRGVV